MQTPDGRSFAARRLADVGAPVVPTIAVSDAVLLGDHDQVAGPEFAQPTAPNYRQPSEKAPVIAS
jgi:hypothetical protein